jgi:peptidoglycan/xylan/chitin deacetylase (PgdA/CDA1 family)
VRKACKDLAEDRRLVYLDRLREEGPERPAVMDPELTDFLSWPEAAALVAKGFAVGSHTVTHPILSRLPAARLAAELAGSRAAIEERLGVPCPWLVYPNGAAGDAGPAVAAAAREAGYRAALSLMGGANDLPPDRFSLDRRDVPGQQPHPVFHLHVSGLYGLLRHLLGSRHAC